MPNVGPFDGKVRQMLTSCSYCRCCHRCFHMFYICSQSLIIHIIKVYLYFLKVFICARDNLLSPKIQALDFRGSCAPGRSARSTVVNRCQRGNKGMAHAFPVDGEQFEERKSLCSHGRCERIAEGGRRLRCVEDRGYSKAQK